MNTANSNNPSSISNNPSIDKSKTKKKVHKKPFINFKGVMRILKREIEIFKELDIKKQKQIEMEVEGMEVSDDDMKVIGILKDLVSSQRFKLSQKDLNSFGKEFVPSNKKIKFPCLEKYEKVKLKKDREHWQNQILTCSKKGKEYIVKTRLLKPMSIYDQKRLEKELRLGQIASKKKLGPKIEEVFYCRGPKGGAKLYIIMEKIKAGNLNDWTQKNKLLETHKKQIKKLIDDLYSNDIMPGFINDSDILVDDTNPNKIKFYFANFKNSSSLDDLIAQKKENSSMDLEWLSDFNEDKINHVVCEKVVKSKMIKYLF
jgi:hypothetical protein